jgi:hypothetical protein
MCECVAQTRIQVATHFATKLAGKAEVDEKASLHNQGIRQVGNKLVAVGYDEYRLRTWPLKKDGTKTGKEKMERIEVVHSYCPHCGEKYPD